MERGVRQMAGKFEANEYLAEWFEHVAECGGEEFASSYQEFAARRAWCVREIARETALEGAV